MKYKQTLSLILAAALCFSVGFADTGDGKKTTSGPLTCDYDTLIKKGLNNNVSLKTAFATREQMTVQLESTNSSMTDVKFLLNLNSQGKDLERAIATTTDPEKKKEYQEQYNQILHMLKLFNIDGLLNDDEALNYSLQSDTLNIQINNAITQANLMAAASKNTVTYALTSTYMNYIQLDDNLSILDEQLANLKEQCDQAIESNQLGLISDYQLKTTQLAYEKTQLSRAKLARQLEITKMNLNKNAGFALTDNVIYKKEIPMKPEDLSKATLAECTEQALKERYEIRTGKETVTLKKKILDVTTDNYSIDTPTWYSAKKDYIQAQKDLDDKELEIRNEIDTLYSEYHTTQAAKIVADKNLTLAQTALTKAQEQYRLGLTTQSKVTDAKIAVANAKLNANTAKWNAELANFKLQWQIGIGGGSLVQTNSGSTSGDNAS